jgi:hypothetical protein
MVVDGARSVVAWRLHDEVSDMYKVRRVPRTWEPHPGLGMAAADVRMLEELRGTGLRFWLIGGLALELATGLTWREHGDVDLAALAPEANSLRAGLRRANLASILRIRARIEVSDSAGDTQAWADRHDPAVRVPWAQALRRSDLGLDYLSPGLVLLMKSHRLSSADELDASVVIPRMDDGSRRSFLQTLPTDHPWRRHDAPSPVRNPGLRPPGST